MRGRKLENLFLPLVTFLAISPKCSREHEHLGVKKSYHLMWQFVHLLRNVFHKIMLAVIVTPAKIAHTRSPAWIYTSKVYFFEYLSEPS
jgi:hypothetical protein